MEASCADLSPKKIAKASIELVLKGDLILAKNSSINQKGFFKKFEYLFETLANLEKQDRVIQYKLLNALMLTSFAKKANSLEQKKSLFELKNNMFLNLCFHHQSKQIFDFEYIKSYKSLVLDYCQSCAANNEGDNKAKHQWKHCKKCNIDRNFFNVVSLKHIYKQGQARIVLSHDRMNTVPFKVSKVSNMPAKGIKEEFRFDSYVFNIKNLDAIQFESVMAMYQKLIKISES